MTKNEAQHVTFEWGSGVGHGKVNGYHLCRTCQNKLLGVIGEFFGLGKGYEEE
jgi:hypothetical protein